MPTRWVSDCGYAIFTIIDTKDGNYNLCVGDSNQVIGTYKSPEEAVVALSKRNTQSVEWNNYLAGKDVPAKFRDWEAEEDDSNF